MSEPAAPADLMLVGKTLQERYRVDSELGRGGMASVYLAWDLLLDKQVVIKLPLLQLLSNAGIRRRFLKEVRELSAQGHPHIVKIQDMGVYENVPYAVLQFLSGGDLDQRMRASGGHLPLAEVTWWVTPIASALDSIHASGCVHRDVKPGNILFDRLGNPYLSDFGIATALETIEGS